MQRLALLMVSLTWACALDLDALRGTGTDTESAHPGVDAGQADHVRDEVLVASPDPDPPTTPPRTSDPPSDDLPTCGETGLRCCDTGLSCRTGACLRGYCTNYGGTYLTTDDCAPDCLQRNAYTAGCTCPAGFAPTASELAISCGDSASSTYVMCMADSVSGGRDLRRAFVYAAATDKCASHCRSTDEECNCPSDTQALSLPVDVRSTCGTAPGYLGLCLAEGASLTAFGGAYQLASDQSCRVVNPVTGDCSCPDGALANTLPLTHGGEATSVVFCSL